MSNATKRVIVVGSGLGGLLTGAYLARHGYGVTMFEKLSLIGGRFTHIDYEGFAVPTGAFHAFPGGVGGPLSHCLRTLGVDIELITPQPAFHINIDGDYYPLSVNRKHYRQSGLRERIGMPRSNRFRLTMLAAVLKAYLNVDRPAADVINAVSHNALALRLFDHLTKFSLGVPLAEASTAAIIQAIFAQKFHDEGFLRHGNRALVDALAQVITGHGGEIHRNAPVIRLQFEGERATGVVLAGGQSVPADMVILNSDMHTTLELLGEHAPERLRRKARVLHPAHGAAHAIRSRQRLLPHQGIDIPVHLDTIAGIVPISAITDQLSPPGWHYALAYQYLDQRRDTTEQIETASMELRGYLGEQIDLFNTAIYRGKHPAATVAPSFQQQGQQRMPPSIPGITNLYCVGQDICGHGIAAEIIGNSCAKLWRRLS